ncbi:hypothetical protein OIU77_008713 [Salix suchowensis]|uniref:Uncharacterized protein n=1 Tax=Salix suchowensis TaxID=1278906 RepID=A0ABQ9ABV9_9ROSI|nr:hypothetical protein OIU78_025319 [Salix suchowensis]KAJ6332713.1 hypothetical protein OIU77_008713 [Salix suchowensis]
MCVRQCFILWGFETASATSFRLALILCCI